MKISIIIPSYNRANYIIQTLESVLNQTSDAWDCFIVDDGSTDQTEELVRTFMQKYSDKPFYWMKNQRTKGAQGARNTGLLQSKGEYLIFLDSDDILDKHCIAHRLDMAKQNAEYQVWAFPVRLFNEKIGDSQKIWNFMNKKIDLLDRFLLHDAPWQTLGCLWSRNAIIQIGMWDERVTSLQDWDAHIQAVIHPNVQVWLDPNERDFDAFYRVGSYDSISKKFATRKGAETNFYLVDKTVDHLKTNGVFNHHLPAFRRFLWIMGTLISIADNGLGKEFYNKYKDYYQFSGFSKTLYAFYANKRFDMNFPKIGRGILSKIPDLFPLKETLNREDTCMNITDKEV